jgi:DNA-directed RNA polymerase specialized sigma24 family protein
MNQITHLIKTFTRSRHAELVSASMPQWWGSARDFQSRSNIEAWVLKQVQDDGGVWA